MNKEEKEILIDLLDAEISSMKTLKFKYSCKASSFAEAMYINKLNLSHDRDLNRLLAIDNKTIIKKVDVKLIQLNKLKEHVNNL